MTQVKRALITGITGQDGSYLSELLLEKPDASISDQTKSYLFLKLVSVADKSLGEAQ